MVTVVGVDPSMTATGVAVLRNGSEYSYTVTSSPDEDDTLRWNRVTAKVFAEFDTRTVVVIEDLPKGPIKATGKFIERAGLLALLRYGASRRGFPVALVNPTTLKKFATGNGGAGKPDMMRAARLLLDARPSNDNEGDAVWCRTMACLRYQIPCTVRDLTTTQLDAIDVVKWPHWDWRDYA